MKVLETILFFIPKTHFHLHNIKFLQHTKMFNSEVFRNEKHNLKYPYIPDHPYRMLIIWGSGSGKTNVLLNLIKQQDNNELELDKIAKNYLLFLIAWLLI